MIKYPNGKKFYKIKSITRAPISTANRGMNLEGDINDSNFYYKEKGLCLVTKRPTPINVVTVDYKNGARITNAYFEKQSTTDYNGVYKGKYIDFEAKSTHSNSSLPLSNIPSQQIEHLKEVIKHKGIAFFIIEFSLKNEVYFLDALVLINYIENSSAKSIPYSFIKEKGKLIKQGYHPRLDYLPIIEEFYFNN